MQKATFRIQVLIKHHSEVQDCEEYLPCVRKENQNLLLQPEISEARAAFNQPIGRTDFSGDFGVTWSKGPF